MLSFMQDNENDKKKVNETPTDINNTPADTDSGVSDNTGSVSDTESGVSDTADSVSDVASSVVSTISGNNDFANEEPVEKQEEYVLPDSTGKDAKQSTILLAVLFIVGALGIWFMIKKASTGPIAASAAVSTQEAQIDSAIAQLTGIETQIHNQVGDVVKKFYQLTNIEQVNVSDLNKNPFKHEMSIGNFDTNSLLNKGNTFSTLKLWSVMQSGDQSCCMINDKLLYVGDTIDGYRVEEIGNKSVRLSLNGSRFNLKIKE